MSTASPAMRLIGNRPPSTTGKTASITARARPSMIPCVSSVAAARVPGSAAMRARAGGTAVAGGFAAATVRIVLVMTQDDGGQRRQIETHGLEAALCGDGDRFHAA